MNYVAHAIDASGHMSPLGSVTAADYAGAWAAAVAAYPLPDGSTLQVGRAEMPKPIAAPAPSPFIVRPAGKAF